MTATKATGAILAILLLLLSSAMVGLASGQTAGAATPEGPQKVLTDTGTTTRFGGGDYVAIKFGEGGDAKFGVIYGTAATPNSVIIFAAHRRYLGGAEVYDENGAKLGRVPIPVWQVWAQKLEDLFEFNDTNQDGLINYVKRGDGLEYAEYPVHEPVYKRVSMHQAWTRSNVSATIDSSEKKGDWSFSVAAADLPYQRVGLRPTPDGAKLEKVEFTFNLHAELVQVDNATVPMYQVTVRKSGSSYEVLSSKKTDPITVSGSRAKYSGKYDHLIKGWDLDATNANPRLLLEWHAFTGFYIPPQVVSWLQAQSVDGFDPNEEASYDTGNGTESVDEDRAGDIRDKLGGAAKRFKDPWVHLDDNWQRIGTLSWATDVTVDGKPGQMIAQIQGARRMLFRGQEGGVMGGFGMLGGYSYPGGAEIFHDPAMDGNVLVSATFAAPAFGGRNLRGIGVAVVGLIVGIVALGGVAYAVRRGKKPKTGYYDESLDTRVRRPGETAGGWEHQYDRGRPPK